MQTNITLGEFTEMAFRRVCELEGTTPEQVFERAARNAIESYLDHVETGADPGMLRDRERRQRVFAQFLAEGGDQLRVWPHTESNKPESFEAAVCQAKQRGLKAAAKLRAADGDGQHLILDEWIDLTGICEDAGWHSASATDTLVELGIDRRDAECFIDYAFAEHAAVTDGAELTPEQAARLTRE